MATLTFVYSDSTAVVGPLATAREPHSWDLCVGHAGRITAPRGWELMRHAGPLNAEPNHPEDDDLVALADAVREGRACAGGSVRPVNGFHVRGADEGRNGYEGFEDVPRGGGTTATATATAPSGGVLAPPEPRSGRRRGHLRVLPDPGD